MGRIGPMTHAHDAQFAEAELDPHIAALDLHGASVAEAHHVTDLFLDQSFIRREQVVKIIHGKGSGALRDALAPFLRRHGHVAAIHQSLREDELGAVIYVILKPRV